MKKIYCLLLGVAIINVFSACDGSGPDESRDDFARAVMLQHWADEIIIPSYADYEQRCAEMQTAQQRFSEAATTENLQSLRSAWLEAYRSWQHVAFFEIGKAEEVSLRNRSNIYPTDTDEIRSLISSMDYNLELPSSYDAQGFPALDFLLYGSGADDDEIIIYLSEPRSAAYLADLVESLTSLASEVHGHWLSSYRDIFIAADGSSATASTDKLVNDFLFHYEKFLRAGKIGIPAGVFSGNVIAGSVEAPYSAIYSKELFFEAFDAMRDFFQGISVKDGSDGSSMEDYLIHVQERNDLADIAQNIENQWVLADAFIQDLDEDFGRQLAEDPTRMLGAFDELQKAVIFLKVDMMQALNIQVDFVDADGD